MTNERLAELIPHIESALEDGYPLQLNGDDLRFLLEAIKARLAHEPGAVRLSNTLCPRCRQFHFEVEDTEAGCIQLLLAVVRKLRLAQP